MILLFSWKIINKERLNNAKNKERINNNGVSKTGRPWHHLLHGYHGVTVAPQFIHKGAVKIFLDKPSVVYFRCKVTSDDHNRGKF